MQQIPRKIPTVLLHSGKSIGNPMKQRGNGTGPHGLLAGVKNGNGEGGAMYASDAGDCFAWHAAQSLCTRSCSACSRVALI